ncbi:hypothetical protein [Kitasatospora sp. NPDC001547]|uniref:hypothetical protein n=1 Tax=Kitasatospora sp. NPDC001547 TaxID=3364015 RepID=UPI0036A3DD80|nr:hypothetical protein KitaXyl93_51100 [Kitasatospora sp. Xyl93]
MDQGDHDVLDRARAEGRLVRLRRAIPGADRLEGFVLGTGPVWTLLAVCTDHRLDGWTAVRTADLRTVRDRGGPEGLTVRALRRRGLWPAHPPGADLPLDDLPGLLTAACAEYGLIALHTEHRDPDVCRVGTVTALRPASLRLHEVDPEARWHPEPTKVRFADVTRVDLGDYYTAVLREFAGPRP